MLEKYANKTLNISRKIKRKIKQKVITFVKKNKKQNITNCLDDQILRIAIAEGGGLGDAIIQTTYIKEIRKLFNKKVVIDFYSRPFSAFKDLPFIDNSYPYSDEHLLDSYDVYIECRRFYIVLKCNEEKVRLNSQQFLDFCNWCKSLTDKILCGEYNDNLFSQYALLFGKNRIEQSDIQQLIPVSRHTPTYCNVREDCISFLDETKLTANEYITINRGVDSKYGNEHPKLWPLPYYEALVTQLKAHYPSIKIVQIGATKGFSDINGVDINLVGKTTLEETKVLLKYSLLHIDGEGGLVHLKRILNGKSVVLFGPTSTKIFAYEQNLNLKSDACPESCEWVTRYWTEGCLRGFNPPKCMQQLDSTKVFSAVKNYLDSLPIFNYEGKWVKCYPEFNNKKIACLSKDKRFWNLSDRNLIYIFDSSLNISKDSELFYQAKERGVKLEFSSAYNVPSDDLEFDVVLFQDCNDKEIHPMAVMEALRILKRGGDLYIPTNQVRIIQDLKFIINIPNENISGLLKITKI